MLYPVLPSDNIKVHTYQWRISAVSVPYQCRPCGVRHTNIATCFKQPFPHIRRTERTVLIRNWWVWIDLWPFLFTYHVSRRCTSGANLMPANILEFYLVRPEQHLALAPKVYRQMLPVPHRSPTFFYSSPNEARFVHNLICPDCSIISSFLLMHKC
jgi:hypothetical protein